MKNNNKSRFVGSLLGCACGDVLGSAVEMQPRQQILQQHPQLVRDFLPSERGIGFGCYTDDTEMTLALAQSIIRAGAVDGADCAAAYAEYFTPKRGYGRSAVKILSALQQGADWRQTGTMLFPRGSFGNGAAMRIAPIGLLYGQRPYPELYRKAKTAVWMTHSHAEAIDAAVLQARAIGLLLGSQAPVDPQKFITELHQYVPGSTLNEKLRQLAELIKHRVGAAEVVNLFGCGVRSADSWPPALWAALQHQEDPAEAIIQAVNLGGDTDTIGAMTGALVGALHGDAWIPQRWFEQLENGPNGRDQLIAVANRLAEISVS